MICKIIGHKPSRISADMKTGECKRCGIKLNVLFDYLGAGIIITGEVKNKTHELK